MSKRARNFEYSKYHDSLVDPEPIQGSYSKKNYGEYSWPDCEGIVETFGQGSNHIEEYYRINEIEQFINKYDSFEDTLDKHPVFTAIAEGNLKSFKSHLKDYFRDAITIHNNSNPIFKSYLDIARYYKKLSIIKMLHQLNDPDTQDLMVNVYMEL